MSNHQIVPFGRYKGKPFEEVLADTSYAQWLAAQDWFQSKFVTFYRLIQERLQLDEDSPEHNAMQLRWMNPILLERLITAVYGDDDPVRRREEQLEADGVGFCNILPEVNGWDIVFTWQTRQLKTKSFERRQCYVELKPTLGDDFPSVLRSMNLKKGKHDPDDTLYFLVVGAFSSSSATSEQIWSYFDKHGIDLVEETDIVLETLSA